MTQEKVTKCKNEGCGRFFGYSELRTRCPFCQTEHAQAEDDKEEKKKEPFKIWVKSSKEDSEEE